MMSKKKGAVKHYSSDKERPQETARKPCYRRTKEATPHRHRVPTEWIETIEQPGSQLEVAQSSHEDS